MQKFHRLMKTAGFEKIDFRDRYAAIELHFDEYGNLAFLRPNYAKVVADYVSELGERLARHEQEGRGEQTCEEHDHFHMVHPDTEWRSCIEHAVKIGLGTNQYELIRI